MPYWALSSTGPNKELILIENLLNTFHFFRKGEQLQSDAHREYWCTYDLLWGNWSRPQGPSAQECFAPGTPKRNADDSVWATWVAASSVHWEHWDPVYRSAHCNNPWSLTTTISPMAQLFKIHAIKSMNTFPGWCMLRSASMSQWFLQESKVFRA